MRNGIVFSAIIEGLYNRYNKGGNSYSSMYNIDDVVKAVDERKLEREIKSKFTKRYNNIFPDWGDIEVGVDVETSDHFGGMVSDVIDAIYISFSFKNIPSDMKSNLERVKKSFSKKYPGLSITFDKFDKSFYISAENTNSVSDLLSYLEEDKIDCHSLYNYLTKSDIEDYLDSRYQDDLVDYNYQMRDTRDFNH